MKIKNNLLVVLSVLLLASFLVVGCSAPEAPSSGPNDSGEKQNGDEQEVFRVAMVLTGPINDAGWNESGYKG